jgi:hypothetical protein
MLSGDVLSEFATIQRASVVSLGIRPALVRGERSGG